MENLYAKFVVWYLLLFVFTVSSFQSNLILPQRRRYFGNGELKTPQEVVQTDKYQNITLWFILNLSRREYQKLKRALHNENRTRNIPSSSNVAKQRDVEGGLFEGDIKFNELLLDKVWHLRPRKRTDTRTPRAVSRWLSLRWPNATVPYLIDSSVGIRTKDRIFRAMQHISGRTCIQFVKRTNENNYVLFEGNHFMCASNVGMQGGQQIISVRFCDNKGMLIHEICHALGFWHEQSRPDRSQHVRILWENIIPSKRVNFARHSFTSIDSLGVDYDLGSIMHYDLFAFSANGQPTMEVLNSNYRGRVGQRCCLSEKDVEQLNLMYQCPRREVVTAPTLSTITPGPLYIQTGTPIALKSADRNQWVLCTGSKCFTNGCPGKIFKRKNVNKCPTSMFSMELVGRGTSDQSDVRNGNLVVLKSMHRGREAPSGDKWIYCETTHCFVTDYCDRDGQFDMSHCHNQVLKIVVDGKSVGEKVESLDTIKLVYTDPTTTTTTTTKQFSCFDNKNSLDRCSKQTPCNVNDNQQPHCQQNRFDIVSVPMPLR